MKHFMGGEFGDVFEPAIPNNKKVVAQKPLTGHYRAISFQLVKTESCDKRATVPQRSIEYKLVELFFFSNIL